jgi:hypothetical protein
MLSGRRLLVLLVAFATTTLITAMGIVEAEGGLVSGPMVALFGLLSLLLVFGVEIDRIEVGPIVVDFSEQKGKDDK